MQGQLVPCRRLTRNCRSAPIAQHSTARVQLQGGGRHEDCGSCRSIRQRGTSERGSEWPPRLPVSARTPHLGSEITTCLYTGPTRAKPRCAGVAFA